MLAWTTLERQKLLSEESRHRFQAARSDPKVFNEPLQLRAALFDFIADFANWDNAIVRDFVETSDALTRVAHETMTGAAGTRPMVVDPFAGGGSIPLEALRVGAEAFASDLNPVAVLLNKVLLEYVPRHGLRLAEEVRSRSEWIRQEAERQLAPLYPKSGNGATPIAFLWSRTILSEAPSAGTIPVEIPLLRSMWLAQRSSQPRALRWARDANGKVKVQEATVAYADGITRTVLRPQLEVFTPSRDSVVEPGPSAGGAATCPVTGFTTPVESVRRQMELRRGGTTDSRLVCVVELRSGLAGRSYRLARADEERVLQDSANWLGAYQSERTNDQPRVPEGELNHLRGFFNVVLYGMRTWGDLFNPRQLVVLLILSKLVREISATIEDREFSLAVEACLALVLGRMADGNSSLTRWQSTGEKISNTFGRQALPMVWDYAEANPFCDATRSLESMFEWVIAVIVHESGNGDRGHAEQASATRHPLPDNSADAIITDPPYYAAVPYADLSDFFYSWLSQALKPRLPELFSERLTPKAEECVQLSHRAAMYREKDKAWFEQTMTRACTEAYRITKPEGSGLFVFASKETEAWEAMLGALVSAGWVITASWPIDTEMSSRLRAQRSATLASSVHIACRPRKNPDGTQRRDLVGEWRSVLEELPVRVHEWMPRLADEGVVGADAIFACLGPALEIFSRYSQVEKANGDPVTLKEYLEYVWAAVAREALSTVLQEGDSGSLEPDARLTVIWLWTLAGADAEESTDADTESEDPDAGGGDSMAPQGYVLEFDAARKIAQGLGANLESLGHVVAVKGDKARLLPVVERAPHLFGKNEAVAPGKRMAKRKQMVLFAEIEEAATEQGWGETGAPKAGTTTLDRAHQAMLLFASGRSEALKRFLVEEGVGRQAPFWKLSQALAALYPSGSEERRWIEGVLARKKGLGFG
jgi:putative DNA methylase